MHIFGLIECKIIQMYVFSRSFWDTYHKCVRDGEKKCKRRKGYSK